MGPMPTPGMAQQVGQPPAPQPQPPKPPMQGQNPLALGGLQSMMGQMTPFMMGLAMEPFTKILERMSKVFTGGKTSGKASAQQLAGAAMPADQAGASPPAPQAGAPPNPTGTNPAQLQALMQLLQARRMAG